MIERKQHALPKSRCNDCDGGDDDVPLQSSSRNQKRVTRRRKLWVLILFDKKIRRLFVLTILSLIFCWGIIYCKTTTTRSGGTSIGVASSVALSPTHEPKIVNTTTNTIPSIIKSSGLDTSYCDACSFPGCLMYAREVSDPNVQATILTLQQSQKQEQRRDYQSESNFATLTQKNANRPGAVSANQDRVVIISPFCYRLEEKQQVNHEQDFAVATFDGHADLGHDVAEYVMKKFASLSATKLSTIISSSLLVGNDADVIQRNVEKALKDTFLEIDSSIPLEQSMNGGCTGTAIVRFGNKLYIANAGDSRSFVATYSQKTGKSTIVYISRRDKPNLDDERQRIKSFNGRIFTPKPPKNPNLSRVIVHSSIKKEDVGLAMSRSIGDYEWTLIGVTAEPIIYTIDLLEETFMQEKTKDFHIFVVSASDGVMDARTPEFIANQIGKRLYGSAEFPTPHHPLLVAESIIKLVTPKNPKWYRDDMSLSIMKIISVS